MAEIRVRVLPVCWDETNEHLDEHKIWDIHGHPIPRGVEVLVIYNHPLHYGLNWNELPQFGCICPYDDHDPECPLPVDPDDD